MADVVQAESWAAKTKAFLPTQALISRVLKQRKFKYDEGVSLNEQGQLFYLQIIVKMRPNTVWSRKWRTPPTNAPGKATKPSISLPDIKVLMLFQVIDENNVKTVCITIFMGIQSSQLLFSSRKVVVHLNSTGIQTLILTWWGNTWFKPAKSSEMKRYDNSYQFSSIILAWILFKI